MNNIDHGSVGGGPHEKLEVVIDSGAPACALPQGWCDQFPTLPLRTGERTTYVEMEVHRPLASVSQMVRRGNIVVFGDPKFGSYVKNPATELRHQLEEMNGIYLLLVWVIPSPDDGSAAADGDLHVAAAMEASDRASASSGGAPGFRRQARKP